MRLNDMSLDWCHCKRVCVIAFPSVYLQRWRHPIPVQMILTIVYAINIEKNTETHFICKNSIRNENVWANLHIKFGRRTMKMFKKGLRNISYMNLFQSGTDKKKVLFWPFFFLLLRRNFYPNKIKSSIYDALKVFFCCAQHKGKYCMWQLLNADVLFIGIDSNFMMYKHFTSENGDEKKNKNVIKTGKKRHAVRIGCEDSA